MRSSVNYCLPLGDTQTAGWYRAQHRGRFNIVFGFHTDGIRLHKTVKSASLWPLTFICLSLPPDIRYL